MKSLGKGALVASINPNGQTNTAASAAGHDAMCELADMLPHAVIETTLDGVITYANKGAIEATGYSAEELAGNFHFANLLVPQERPIAAANFKKVIAGEHRNFSDYTGMRKNGAAVPISVKGMPIVRDGKVAGFRMVVMDASGRKSFEAALKAAKESFIRLAESNANIAEGSPPYASVERFCLGKCVSGSDAALRGILTSLHESMIIIMGREGVFDSVFMPPELEESYGIKESEISGRRLDQIHVEDQAALKLALVRQVLETGKPFRGEGIYDAPNGRFWQDFSIVPLRSGEKSGEKVVVFVRDITEQKKLFSRLIMAERMGAIGTLAGGVAHEFNNINTSILGFAEFALESQSIDDDVREFLKKVVKGARRAAAITKSLLTFTRSQAMQPETSDLSKVAEDALQLLDREFTRAGIKVESHFDELPNIAFDPGQVGQVVFALLQNAQHALMGRQDKRLWVSTGLKDGRIFLQVRDNGCGMPEENLRKIFTPFFSTKGEYASDPEMAKVKGSGLGLCVSLGIIRNHNGEISAESAPGRGSTFTVWLPVAQ